MPPCDLHMARDTLRDVGTAVTTATEYQREDLWSVVAANWNRVQQALRSLEEYAKVIAPQAAPQLEALRYRAYTVERTVTILSTSVERLAAARLYVLVDGRSSMSEFRRLVEQLIQGGVDVLQLRDKTMPDRELLERARALRELTRRHDVLFIMNDRADLAAMAHADGVHLGQEEIAVQDARVVLGSHALVGVSTHSIEQARQAVVDGANYLGCGPTFPSATKEFAQFPGAGVSAASQSRDPSASLCDRRHRPGQCRAGVCRGLLARGRQPQCRQCCGSCAGTGPAQVDAMARTSGTAHCAVTDSGCRTG